MKILLAGLFAASMLLSANSDINSPTTTPDLPTTPPGQVTETPKPENPKTENITNLNLTIANSTFQMKLYENSSTAALTKLLPLTIKMEDLNSNEKFYFLPNPLPTESSNPGQIKTGDFMLYGDNCLVLFYKNFNSSYSYTPLGNIEDISGFAQAVGNGDVTITFTTGT